MDSERRGFVVHAWRQPSGIVATILGILLLIGSRHRVDAQPGCVSVMHFELAPQASLPDGLQGKLILHPKEGKSETLALSARVGSPVSAELPCASEWEVSADFPNVWGPRKDVVAGAPGVVPATMKLPLWPLGRIAGTVRLAEKGERLPQTIVVRTLSPRFPARRDRPIGSMECSVDDRGKWSCPPLPAMTFDLVVSAAGFIPQYSWGLTISPGKTTEIGTLVLKKGASVAGWVEVEGGAIDPACRARLTPLVGPGGGALAEKVRSTGREVSVRKDGFFQIEGVAPGDYAMEVRQPGFATAMVHPVVVSPRSETFLRQPVVLTHPLDIELAIFPPLDWLGRPWKVLLFQASSETGNFDKTIHNGPADDRGTVRAPQQTPGRFRALIADSLDNQLAVQTFQVTGPENASQAIHLKFLTVRGVVKLGNEPLAATLWFGGRHGSESVEFASDRDGKFHGVLPRDGWWTVDVSSAVPKFETRTRVKVKSEGQDGARAEIDLPATRVYGKVVDDAGHPMPAATVMVSTNEGAAVHMDTDGTGSFDLRGLAEGLAYAVARLSSGEGEWSSDRISLFLQDGEDFGPLEIRMRRETKLSGSVQSARGPVPGAGVMVFGIRPSLMGGDSVRTEMDGTFTAHVPAPAELADVMVSAPGFGLKAFPVAMGEGSTQPLVVEEQSGELRVLLPPSPSDEPKDATTLWIFQNGLYLSKQALFQWASAHGREFVSEASKRQKSLILPELAPGEYRACLAAPADLVPWQASGWTAPLAQCVSGTLTAGGTLRLDLAKP